MLDGLQQLTDALPALIGNVGEWMNQYGGQGADPWDDTGARAGPSFGIGQLIMLMLIGIGINTLFGFWAKSRGDDHGIHPVLSFCAGFFLGWIGVLIVPLLKTDRVINTPRRRPPPMQPYGHQPNPMYGAGPPQQPPPGPMLNQPPQQNHGPPMSQPGQAAPYSPQQPPPGPAAPPPGEPAQMLVADDDGYVECPACSARTKGGRKACMSCGTFLPPVYDPNAGG